MFKCLFSYFRRFVIVAFFPLTFLRFPRGIESPRPGLNRLPAPLCYDTPSHHTLLNAQEQSRFGLKKETRESRLASEYNHLSTLNPICASLVVK